jgi:hypothetical protein
MSILLDIASEFKDAPPAGKALMVVAVIAVAGVGIYAYKVKSGASSSSLPTGTTSLGDTSTIGTSGFSGTTSSTAPVATTSPKWSYPSWGYLPPVSGSVPISGPPISGPKHPIAISTSHALMNNLY